MKTSLLLLLTCLNISVFAQSFGPDRTIFVDPDYEVREQFLSVAFNGWIYNAFNYYSMPMTGYRVSVSKDNGNTWQTVIDFSVPGASGWYPQIEDMLVAGTDTLNLRIVLALLGPGNGGPENFGIVRCYDASSGIPVGTEVQIGDFTTYAITDIALATDSKYPMSTSSPYSVAIAYSVRNSASVDSLNYYLSEDGGLNFDGPYWLDSTAGSYGKVDISYGTGQGGSDGRFGIVAERNGHLSVLFTIAGLPSWFTVPLNVDTLFSFTNAICGSPEICMQSSLTPNSAGGFSTSIFAVADNPGNATKDMVSFFLPATPGGTWGLETVDGSLDNSTLPAQAYSQNAGGFFTATFYNSVDGELPFYYRSQDAGGMWIDLSYVYPDTLRFSTPYPATCISEVSGTEAICSWKQVVDTGGFVSPLEAIKFDMMNLTSGVPASNGIGVDFTIFPNPSRDGFNLQFKKELRNVSVELLDVTGKTVFSKAHFAVTSETGRLRLPAQASGVYFLRVTAGTGTEVVKLIAE